MFFSIYLNQTCVKIVKFKIAGNSGKIYLDETCVKNAKIKITSGNFSAAIAAL